jgi:hypothetical protein
MIGEDKASVNLMKGTAVSFNKKEDFTKGGFKL